MRKLGLAFVLVLVVSTVLVSGVNPSKGKQGPNSPDVVEQVISTNPVSVPHMHGWQTDAEVVAQVWKSEAEVVAYATLIEQAIAEAAYAQLIEDALAEQERARQEAASRPASPRQPTQVSPPSNTGDCGGVNQYAAYIYMRESGCNPAARNAGGCLGIGQACPGSKLPCSLEDFACQHEFFEGYAMARYGSWEAAYQFWLRNHWW